DHRAPREPVLAGEVAARGKPGSPAKPSLEDGSPDPLVHPALRWLSSPSRAEDQIEAAGAPGHEKWTSRTMLIGRFWLVHRPLSLHHGHPSLARSRHPTPRSPRAGHRLPLRHRQSLRAVAPGRGRGRQLRGFRAIHGRGERVHAAGQHPVPRLGSHRSRARSRRLSGPRGLAPAGGARLRGAPSDLRGGHGTVPGNQVPARLLGLLRVGGRAAPGHRRRRRNPAPVIPPSMRAPLDLSPARTPAASTPAEHTGTADWLLLLGPGLIWGASFLFIAEGLQSVGPNGLTFARILVGFVILGLVPSARRALPREDRGKVA